MKITSIGFIGGGRITRIFLQVLYQKNQTYGNIIVSDPDTDVRSELKQKFPEISVTDNNKQSAKQDLVFLALHPQIIKDALTELSDAMNPKSILISLAPKVTILQLTTMLGGFDRIVRAIPNSPSIINKGYNPLCFGESIDSNEKILIEQLFDLCGDHVEVEEGELEAYAIISAMGPTYFQFQFNKLFELAKQFGINDGQAKLAVKKMISGINELMFESGFSYEVIEDLIPVKPLKSDEENIIKAFDERLTSLNDKLKQ